VELSEIEEVFLLKGDDRWTEDKIKRRGQNGSFTYQRKYRGCQDKNGDYCQEIRKPLTSMQYVLLKEERRDKDYKAVVRQRYHFIHNGLPYSIDVYDNIHGQEKTYILRFANLNGQEARSLIPSFLVATEDVRLDARYTLHSIARIQ
jgi:predicted cupin superfamily sugar epimerase